jgi:predicted esterase YcpF (UPF0227 family)
LRVPDGIAPAVTKIIVNPALAPSEMVDQYVAQQKKIIDAGSDAGKFSDFKSGMRSVGRQD